jgi:hypothetical protein
MDSLTLKENGFADFVPLKGLQFSSLPLNKAGILVLADSTLTGKAAASDILYIGKTKKLNKKVFGGYLAGFGGKTTRRIHTKLLGDGFIEKVTISWMLDQNPKTKQQELLNSFQKEHNECPPWNASKKAPVNLKPAPKVAKPRPSKKQPVKR